MSNQLELTIPTSSPHFRSQKIERNGKLREIHIPDEEARAFHDNLLKKLYSLDIEMPHATGGVQKKSWIDNVRPHADSKTFYMFDIKDAFPSVNKERLAQQLWRLGVFESLGEARELLDTFCFDTVNGGLYQGVGAAPYLFNLYCAPLDAAIGEYCAANDLVFTRYFDDFTISAPEGVTLGKKRRRSIRSFVLQDGWRLSEKEGKSRVHTLDKPVTITGISLYPDGFWQLSPALIEKVRQVFESIYSKVWRGRELSESEIGQLHGYYGLLVSSHDPRRSRFTKVELRLIEFYDQICLEIEQNQKGRTL